MKLAVSSLFLLGILFMLGSVLNGQNINATILGTVTDPTQAVVPRVLITATHVTTNLHRTALTNTSGHYELLLLPPGEYVITAEAKGFRKVLRTGVTLQLEQRVPIDFHLELGSTSESVTVAERSDIVESYGSDRGIVVDSVKALEIPLNGRNFTALIKLMPGIIDRSTDGGAAAGNYPPYTFAGIRPAANRYYLDGASNMDSFYNDTIINPSIDAIQEFNVKANHYNAEYGGGGGIINATIKSGTNQLHGTAFEFLRNDKLDARPFFAPRRSAFRYNQFGGVISGPVWIPKIYDGRNRTFFLFNYETLRVRSPSDRYARVPTAAERNGDFSALSYQVYDPFNLDANNQRLPFANNQIPKSRWNPYAQNVISYWPSPNMPLNQNNQNYFRNAPGRSDRTQYNTRTDLRISDKWLLFGRGSWSDDAGTSPELYTGSGGNNGSKTTINIVGGLTTIFSQRVLNEFRLSYSRRTDMITSPFNKGINYDKLIGFPYADTLDPDEFGFPIITLNDMSGFGSPDSYFRGPNDIWNASESFSVIKGRHAFKAGFNIETYHTSYAYITNRGYTFQGQYSALVAGGKFATRGYGFADFLLGTNSVTRAGLLWPGIPRGAQLTKTDSFNGYFQDEWKISPRLTINLGVRYEFNLPPTEDYDRTYIGLTSSGMILYPKGMNVDDKYLPPQFSTPRTTGNQVIPAGKYFERIDRRTMWNTDKNNIQPRLGLAIRPFGDNRTSVRAFGGIFNPRPQGITGFLSANGFYKFVQEQNDATLNPGSPKFGVLPVMAAGDPGGLGSIYLTPLDSPNSFISNWGLEIQREITHNSKLTVGYLGNKVDHLIQRLIKNIRQVPGAETGLGCPAPCPVSRPFPRRFPWLDIVNFYGPYGWSRYHGMHADFEQRLASGLTLTTNFTWAKGMDIESDTDMVGGGQPDQQPQNYYNLRAEKAVAGDSPLKRFSATWVYELPFGKGKPLVSANGVLNAVVGGWQLSGLFAMQDGFPFSVNVDGDITGDGTGRKRANRIADGNLPTGQRTLARWFDTSAFTVPALNTYGNSGRRILKGPGLANLDFGLSRRINVFEGHTIQIRGEFFNTTNHPNFSLPNSSLTSSTVGRITSTSTSPRNIQLALKYIF